jgi:hypothetical protein
LEEICMAGLVGDAGPLASCDMRAASRKSSRWRNGEEFPVFSGHPGVGTVEISSSASEPTRTFVRSPRANVREGARSAGGTGESSTFRSSRMFVNTVVFSTVARSVLSRRRSEAGSDPRRGERWRSRRAVAPAARPSPRAARPRADRAARAARRLREFRRGTSRSSRPGRRTGSGRRHRRRCPPTDHPRAPRRSWRGPRRSLRTRWWA